MTAPEAPQTPAEQSKRPKWPWIAAGVVVAVGAAVAGGFALGQRTSSSDTAPSATTSATVAAPATTTAPARTFTMNGAFDLFVDPSPGLKEGDSCRGTGTYSDISVTTSVHVFNGSGQEIATGQLGRGEYVSNPVGTACTFQFNVTGVPDGLPQYWVEVGSHGEQPVASPAAHYWVFLHS